MKKHFPSRDCSRVPVEEEVCVTTVKLEEEEREVRSCSFHPVTLCRESADRGCVTVNRTLCDYIDSNEL